MLRTNRPVKPAPQKTIDRTVICQAFLDALGGGNYLEIGVSQGESFMPVRARRKWGVDPGYSLSRRRLVKLWLRVGAWGSWFRLFRMTSDDFFARHGRLLTRRGVDVALLDGLHTYAQTLRDMLSTLEHLTPDGVVVIHDCNPATELAATPAESYEAMLEHGLDGRHGNWNGDVWKVIVHLRSLRPDLETVVLDCDHGVGVVRRKPGGTALRLSAEQIGKMTFADLKADRAALLGLKPPGHLWEMTEEIRRGIQAMRAQAA